MNQEQYNIMLVIQKACQDYPLKQVEKNVGTEAITLYNQWAFSRCAIECKRLESEGLKAYSAFMRIKIRSFSNPIKRLMPQN